MDTNTKNQPTDLIAQKTAEYDNLPGLILGLDGWILRSVPKHLRAQFLNGYEKLLKVVFHPDRYQEQRTKESRQMYLQSVGEAVRFMLADEFSFEITADSVPSHKNPLLTLREAITVRDNIIAKIDDRLEDKTLDAAALRMEVQELRTKLIQTVAEAERRSAIDHQLKGIVRKVVKGFPVPIGLKYCVVSGSFLELREDSFMTNSIGRFSSDRNLSDDSEWIVNAKWMSELRQEQLLEKPLTLKFRRSVSDNCSVHYTMIGGMTIAHLCEFIRAFNQYPAKPIDGRKTMKAIEWLQQPIDLTEPQTEFHLKTFPFLLPYYNAEMLLLMLVKEAGVLRHRIFMVKSVDAGDSQVKAIADGLQRENDAIKKNSLELHAELQTTKAKLRDANKMLDSLTRKMKRKSKASKRSP